MSKQVVATQLVYAKVSRCKKDACQDRAEMVCNVRWKCNSQDAGCCIPCARDKKGGVPVWTATFCCLECSTSTVHTAQRDAHTVWKSVFSGFGVVKNRPCCRSGFCAHLEGAVINPVHERMSISKLSSDWRPRGEHTVILRWGRRGATASGFRARRG